MKKMDMNIVSVDGSRILRQDTFWRKAFIWYSIFCGSLIFLSLVVFSVFMKILLSGFVFSLWWVVYRFRKKYMQKNKIPVRIAIAEGLREIIVSNVLYSDSGSALLGFQFEGDSLVITGIKQGNQWTRRVADLQEELSALLGIPLAEKNDQPSTCEYVFLLNPPEPIEQLTFTSESLSKSFFDGIPLDVIVLTNKQAFSLQNNTNMGLYGRTGAGKTVALQWYLYNAVAKGCGTDPDTLLSVVDGKGADLYSLGEILKGELQGKVSVGQTPQSLAKLSREFVEAMNERFEGIKQNTSLNADAYDLGQIPNFLFVDELASIRDSCGSSKQGKELWNEILQNLGLIARKGRQAACHLCISTQDPNAENIPVELRNQISSVVYLGNPGNDRIRMAFSMCELENVPTVTGRKGEALFYADGNDMVEPEITVMPFVDVKTKQEFIKVINNIKPQRDNII